MSACRDIITYIIINLILVIPTVLTYVYVLHESHIIICLLFSLIIINIIYFQAIYVNTLINVYENMDATKDYKRKKHIPRGIYFIIAIATINILLAIFNIYSQAMETNIIFICCSLYIIIVMLILMSTLNNSTRLFSMLERHHEIMIQAQQQNTQQNTQQNEEQQTQNNNFQRMTEIYEQYENNQIQIYYNNQQEDRKTNNDELTEDLNKWLINMQYPTEV